MSDDLRKLMAVVVLAGAVGAMLWAGFAIFQSNSAGHDLGSEFRWGVLPIICAASFVLILMLLSTIFSLLGLTEKGQALGLPDGTIRAVIALVLLAMFIVIPICLYSSMGSNGKTIENVDEAGKTDFIKNGNGQYVSYIVTRPAVAKIPEIKGVAATATTPAVAAKPETPAVGALYTIFYRDANPVKDEFAKMILAALIALVSSVSSFFFGAATVKSAQASNFAQAKDLMQTGTPTISLTGTAGDKQAVLSWTPYPGATSYNVYRSATSGGQESTPIKANLTGTAFTDTPLANDTTIYYKVSASIATGESARSNEVSVTPKAV